MLRINMNVTGRTSHTCNFPYFVRLPILKLEIVIGRINYCDKEDPYCLSRNVGRQEVKCFILLMEAASVQFLSIIVSLQSVQYWGHTYLNECKNVQRMCESYHQKYML